MSPADRESRMAAIAAQMEALRKQRESIFAADQAARAMQQRLDDEWRALMLQGRRRRAKRPA